MNFNLVDIIKDQLNGRRSNQIGGILKLGPSQLNSAIGSIIPGLLSELLTLNSDATKAKSLILAIKNQDDAILESLDDILANHDRRISLLSAGTHLQLSLFGNRSFGNLVSAVSAYSGVSNQSSQSLLGFFAPITLAVIKRVLLNDGELHLTRLTNLLSEQKNYIAAAMPLDFEQHLSTSTLTDDFAAKQNDATENISDATEHAMSTGSAWLARLIPLAIFLGVMWFAYHQFLKNKIATPTTESAVNPTAASEAVRTGQVTDSTHSQTNVKR